MDFRGGKKGTGGGMCHVILCVKNGVHRGVEKKGDQAEVCATWQSLIECRRDVVLLHVTESESLANILVWS